MKKAAIITIISLISLSTASLAANQNIGDLKVDVNFINQTQASFSCTASNQLSGKWRWNNTHQVTTNNSYAINTSKSGATMSGNDNTMARIDLQCVNSATAENFHIYASLGTNDFHDPIAFCTSSDDSAIICSSIINAGSNNAPAVVNLYIDKKNTI